MVIIFDSVTVAETLKFTFPSKHTPATRILDLFSPQTAKIPNRALTVSKQVTAGTNGVCACVCLCSVQSEAEILTLSFIIQCLFFFPSLLLHS